MAFKQTNSATMRGILAGLVGLTLAAPALAKVQDANDLTALSLEELLNVEVYSASKFTQKITEAPASVSIVTAADIKNYGYRSLAELLRGVRGLFVSNDRNYTYLGTRGFNRPGDYNNRVLLLIDGVRINEAVYDSVDIDSQFVLDMNLIDRVEVVRGAGSAIYGSNAVFGVINVLTKRGGDFNGWQASGEVASFGNSGEQLTYGRKFENNADLLLSASHSGSRGQDLFYPEFNTPANNNGVAQGLDRDVAKRLYGKLSLDSFTLTAMHAYHLKGIPTASFGTVFNDPRSYTEVVHNNLSLGYDGAVSERQEVNARVYYNDYTYTGQYPWNQPPVTVNYDSAMSAYWGAEAKLVSRLGGHKLVMGAEYQNNFRQNQLNQDISPTLLYLDSRHSSSKHALYVQDEMTLRDNLKFDAGLRYDHYSTVGNSFNPRLALIYNFRPETVIKLLYGTAFRAPNAYELYYVSTNQKTSLNLKPEQVTSRELIIEHQFQPNLRLTASTYYNQTRNLIDQVIDPADGFLVFQNAGLVYSQGAEFELERAWSDDTRLRVSYAWQSSEDRRTDQTLVNSPRHLAKLNYSVPLWDNALRCGAELQYTGSRKTLAGNLASGYTLANLTLTHLQLLDVLELSASIYNLFDARYVDPGRPEHLQDVIAQNGRNFRLKLTYQF